MAAEKPKRGNPNWVKGGPSPNPGGQTQEQREARDLLRKLLADDAKTVHDMLMSRIREGSDLLIKYAHEQLHGKAPDKLEADVSRTPDPFADLTVEELRALVKRG